MLLAIHMPEWLVDFWTVYGNMITPILITLLTSVMTYICVKIRADAKMNAAKTDLEIKTLKEVANRENTKPEVEALKETITELQTTIVYLSDMFNLAFQNSELDPEIKDNLTALINKIKYGTETDLVKDLQSANGKLQERIDELTKQLEEKVSLAVSKEETKITRTRR